MSVAVNWQKSSFSGGGDGNNCVELAAYGESIAIREGDAPETVLLTSARSLRALLGSVKQGQYEAPGEGTVGATSVRGR